MVQKLQNSEYLKRYCDMTAAEREAYGERVGEWMRSGWKWLDFKSRAANARMQNVLAVSAAWNDEECRAFEQGARLLSALIGTTDTWLPDMLYVKSAKRAIDLMHGAFLSAVAPVQLPEDAGNADGKPKEEAAEGTAKATQPVGGKSADVYDVKAGGAASVSPDAKPTTATQPVPARPKHIDQYIHLLPEKTQEKAAKVKDLLRGLDEAREKMRLLADDKTAKDDDRAAWAKKATSIDNTLRKIYDELDGEWARLVSEGRVVVDDLGNARVVETATETRDPGDAPLPELTSAQKARRRELRKWLVDTRRGNGDKREEHVGKWKENFREFLSLEGDAAFEDAKILESARHYGIGMDELKAGL